MDNTPAHDRHNPALLAFIPTGAAMLIEVGCSSGALAREYKKINRSGIYVGVECVPEFVRLANRYCDSVIELDIESATPEFFAANHACDCWIFGDCLEHLRDPWSLLAKIRKVIPPNGSVVACIPNAQHWSIQARLCCGEFKYEDEGLLDKTHLRWFTRLTIIEMFHNAGFKIEAAAPRVFDEPDRDRFMPAIRSMAASMGADPEMAARDAMPLQYVIRTVAA